MENYIFLDISWCVWDMLEAKGRTVEAVGADAILVKSDGVSDGI